MLMKRYIWVIFCLPLFLYVSCDKVNQSEEDEYVSISFTCGGELEITTTPMAKAENSNDLYMFMFYEAEFNLTVQQHYRM